MKILFLLAILPIIYCLNNGLGRTPQMGWNSWNKFACSINEDLIKQTADAMISTGLADAGYEYVNLDDCWQISRENITGAIVADAKAFPSGMKALSDYIHKRNLKFGLYSSAGVTTCQGRPGGLFYEEIDAKKYAEWEVDYLKYDNCANLKLPPKFRYPRMRDALNKTGRPIFYSLCEWGQDDPWDWAADVGNSWRTTGDISDNWKSVMDILEKSANISGKGAPGGWNDPDMLEVGNGGMTTTEYESHFALWAFMKAPLIIGCDVRNMSADTLRILTNKEIIAINQDSLGKPATRLFKQDNQQIWGGPIADGYAAIFFNSGESTENYTAKLSLFGLSGSYKARDLSTHQDIGVVSDQITVKVASHGIVAVKFTKQNSGLRYVSV